MKKLTLLVMAMALLVSGCASMFSSSSDSMRITSEPEGAKIYFNGNYLGETPLTTELHRQTAAPVLHVEKEGYESKDIMPGRTLTGAAFLNFFFITTTFGATSWGIDAASGKMFEYSPRSYVIELVKKGETTPSAQSSALEFVIVNYEPLKREIVQGGGETLSAMCCAFLLSGSECDAFVQEAVGKRSKLLEATDGLQLYRRLKPLSNPRV